MESSIGSDKQKKSNASTLTEKPNARKDHTLNPEEKNWQGSEAQLSKEMLEYFHQQSKELRRCRRKYEEARKRVYGTIASGDEPEKVCARNCRFVRKNQEV